MLLALAGCAVAGDPPAGASAGSSVPSASAVASAASSSPTAPSFSAVESATRRLEGRVNGTGDLPSYTVEAASGWSVFNGSFIVKAGGPVIGVSVWDVDQVPGDPCQWLSTMATPGPAVDDLVEALVAQRTREATEPVAVTLDGHPGFYLEWTVPADLEVTGDSDFAGCDTPGNGHYDFVSWLSSRGGERYQQEAGQLDRLWILDVDGQRLVVDATSSPNSTDSDVAELVHAAESIRFETP